MLSRPVVRLFQTLTVRHGGDGGKLTKRPDHRRLHAEENGGSILRCCCTFIWTR